jgi:hypothetical protein
LKKKQDQPEQQLLCISYRILTWWWRLRLWLIKKYNLLVYKYRDGNINKFEEEKHSTFERDLLSIEKNYFWASNRKQLNDPSEGFVTKNSFEKQSGCLSFLLSNNSKKNLKNVDDVLESTISFREKLGIYSLSKEFNDELLWAYYGNSHYGFCLEYDLDILLEDYNHYFSVTYSDKPADIGIPDVSNNSNIFKKIAGHKSSRWKHEQEIRILTDKFGVNQYKHTALKSIYFGYNMDPKEKSEIMNRLKGRGLNYYQIELLPNTYKFIAKSVKDINESEITYLKQIPSEVTGSFPVKFEIIKNKNWAVKGKGNIETLLEKTINEKELMWLANTIKENLFFKAEMVIMLHYIKNKDNGMAWATTHYQNGKINININGFLEE